MAYSEIDIFGKESFVDDGGLIRLTGSVEKVIYSNEENGYAVCDLGTDDDDLVTITGIMPYVADGDQLTVWGEWKHNPKYGRQFCVTQYEKSLPANAVAILRYLSSGAIKGVGKKTAQKIVDEFGDETLDVLENHPDWLSDIPGMSVKKAKQISEDFRAKAGIRTAMLFFREFFGAALTIRIYKRWGAAAVDIAKKDPYRLCDEVEGIGFEKADRMAMKLGLDKDSRSRLASGILYVLSSNSTQNGHVCMPEKRLKDEATALLGTGREQTELALDSLVEQKKVKTAMYGGITYIYDRYSYDCERFIATKLALLDKLCPAVDAGDIRLFIENQERKNGFAYAAAQRQAIADALESGVLLLTGGPGTGKTTVVKALLGIFQSMDLKVALTAPTGRAAKRLSESTSCEAKTLHRLLEYDYSEGDGKLAFRRNQTDLLDEHVIIVDEASMVDNALMAALLRAIKPGARLIIIGDADQLPSVGAGNILQDLLESGRFSTVRLNEIFRQAKQSLIVTNAHMINKGEMPRLDVKDNDFFFLPRATDREIALTVTDLCRNRLPRTYGELAVNGTQVISPSRKGEAGTENLNIMLQQSLNPAVIGKKEYKFREIVFREGDRVMQVKNNYEVEWCREDDRVGTGIFNGDIGIIKKIDLSGEQMEIIFDDRHVMYDFSMLDELDHAYAITVHKSQGCEYPIVIIPLYGAPLVLLTRKLFYTAVTRAQRMVILVGRAEIAAKMVANDRQSERHTGLRYLLLEES